MQAERPEQQTKLGRGGLEERRDIDVERSEASAQTAQLGAVFLAQALHFLGHRLAREHAQRLDEPVGEPARYTLEALALLELDERFERCGDVPIGEFLQARLNLFTLSARQLVAGNDGGARLQQRGAGLQLADGSMVPYDLAITDQLQVGVG